MINTKSSNYGNSSFSDTDLNVKPKSSQMYLYMYSDRQITGVKK